jgi:mevalonate kinase
MGSSAALSVALVRARAQAQGHDLSPDELFEQAMKAERIFHTMPSGLDALVSGQGGVVYFEKGEPPRTESLPQPKWSIIVLDSGHSGNTSAMVKQVAAQRPAVNQTLAAIGDLSRAAKKQLADVTVLGELLTENHRLLSQLGVSTPELDSLVKVALDAGAAGAKLSGAGGGGVVIAVTADPEAVLSRVLRRNINGFTCTIWSDKDEECKLQP